MKLIKPSKIELEPFRGGYKTNIHGNVITMTDDGLKPLENISLPNIPLEVDIFLLPYSYRQYLNGYGWDSQTIPARSFPGCIVIGPEVTEPEYVALHELGHELHRTKLNFDMQKMSPEFKRYMDLRGISSWKYGSAAPHNKRAEEVFADDFAFAFGAEPNYEYYGLVKPEPEVIDYIESFLPEVESMKHEYIIIHHSATSQGGVESFRRSHKAKGWRDVGYHYVIGNGTQSGDGEIEKGRSENEVGAHCPEQNMNSRSIGICLVGNFQEQKPTAKQMQSLEKLCRELMQKYCIPYDRVKGHGEIMTTNCPGKNFSMEELRNILKGEGAKNMAGFEGSAKVIFKGKQLPAGILEGRTYVELRTVAELLELNIAWDNATKTVTLTERR